MSLAEDIAGDWEWEDGIETVTVTQRNADGTTAADADAKALRGELSHRELGIGGPAGIEPTDIVWKVWSATLTNATPKRGGTITDSGSTVWTILSLTERTIGSVSIWHRCICRKQ